MDFHKAILIPGRGWELVRVGKIQWENGGAEDVELVYGWALLEAEGEGLVDEDKRQSV